MSTEEKENLPDKKGAKKCNAELKDSEIKQRISTEIKLSATVQNAVTAKAFSKPMVGQIELTKAMDVMSEKADKINEGDFSELESTLSAQVVSLNAIFGNMARRSAISDNLRHTETNMRLALKAQAQCMRTIEAIAAIKNPTVVYAKQANIAQGHQQVNNGCNHHAHGGETINSPNELLNEVNDATLDTQGTDKASRADQDLAAVETINRRKDPKGKG